MRTISILIVALALITGACGDDDASTSTVAATPSSVVTSTTTITATTAAPTTTLAPATTAAPTTTTLPPETISTPAPSPPLTVLRVTTSPLSAFTFTKGEETAGGGWTKPGPDGPFNPVLRDSYETSCGPGGVTVTLLLDRGGQDIALDDMFVLVYHSLVMPGVDPAETSTLMRYLGNNTFQQNLDNSQMIPKIPPPGRTPSPTASLEIRFVVFEGPALDDYNPNTWPRLLETEVYQTDTTLDLCVP